MSDPSSIITQSLKILTQFLTDNSIIIATSAVLITFKGSISSLISRLTDFAFKRGQSEVSFKAQPLKAPSHESSEELAHPTEHPIDQDSNAEINDDTKSEDWFSKIYDALVEDRLDDAETAFKEYALSENNEEDLEKNKAIYFFLRFSFGNDTSAISSLENLARTSKTENSKYNVLSWLSQCLKESFRAKKEIKTWRDALQEFSSEELITRATVKLAYALDRDNQTSEAKQKILSRLPSANTDLQKSELFNALSSVENSFGNKNISIYCKDKSLEYDPENKQKIFDTAYEASDNSSEISISNYLRLTKIDSSNSNAMNNLGVCAQQQGSKLKSVEYYKKAAEQRNTLAMANQGYLLLNAGFLEEANKIADEALKEENPHQNIYDLKSSINTEKEKQVDSWNNITRRALSRQKALRSYIEQYYLGEEVSLTGEWLVGDQIIKLKPERQKIHSHWYDRKEPSGARFENILEGRVTGSTFSGKYIRKEDQEHHNNPLLIPNTTTHECLGYLCDDGSELHLISSHFDDNFSLSLRRNE